MKLLEFFIDISVRASDAVSGLSKIGKSSDQAKASLNSVGDTAVRATGKLAGFGRTITTAFAAGVASAGAAQISAAMMRIGSNAIETGRWFEEMVSKRDAVFGPAGSAAVQKWAESFANAAGRSKSQLQGMATDFASFLRGMGIAGEKLPGLSGGLVQLAEDVASFNNAKTEDVAAAFQSALAGEAEAVRRYGIDLSEAAIKAELLAMGVKKANDATQAQKTQARANLINKGAARTGAAGDATRTKGSNANLAKAAEAKQFEALIAAGQMLKELDRQLQITKGKAAELFLDLPDGAQTAALAIGGLLTVLAPIASIFAAVASARAFMTVSQLAGAAATTADTAATTANTASRGAQLAAMARAGVAWVAEKTAIIASTAATWINTAAMRAYAIGSALVVGATRAITLGFNLMKAALLSNPLMLIIAAIAAAAYLIYSNWGSIGPWFSAIWQSVSAAAGQAWVWIKAKFNEGLSWLSALPGRLLAIGGQLMQGLANGITSGVAWVRDAIAGVVDKVKGWFADPLGIRSPSRVFAGFGGDMTDGLALGLQRGTSRAAKAVAALATAVSPAMAMAGTAIGNIDWQALDSRITTSRAVVSPRALPVSNRTSSVSNSTSNVHAPVNAKITINGARDPQSVANEVRRELDRRDRGSFLSTNK